MARSEASGWATPPLLRPTAASKHWEEATDQWEEESQQPVSKRLRYQPLAARVKVKAEEAAVPSDGRAPELSHAKVSAASLQEDHPDWAQRCTVDAAKPGQPQRLRWWMAEAFYGDTEMAEWCKWISRSLLQLQTGALPKRVRFKASLVDFSSCGLSASGIQVLSSVIERFQVHVEVLKLIGNEISDQGARFIGKILTVSSQATNELHIQGNRLTIEGIKWLLMALAFHPAYPAWHNTTESFVPLWLRAEQNEVRPEDGLAELEQALPSLSCTVCCGSRCGPQRCEVLRGWQASHHQALPGHQPKPDCVAHLGLGLAEEDGFDLTPSVSGTEAIFADAGRAAPKAPPSMAPEPLREEPRLLYEDADMMVVFKPAGWSYQPNVQVDPAKARLPPLGRRAEVAQLMIQAAPPSLQAWLLLHLGTDFSSAGDPRVRDQGVLHRHEEEISGPLLVAKTQQGYEHVRKQLVRGMVEDYVVLVHGTFSVVRGECVAPLDLSAYAAARQMRVSDTGSGQSAVTLWEVLAEYESSDQAEQYSLLRCRLLRPRTHQLRAHLQYLGHPVVGDTVYRAAAVPAFCPRLFLHKLRIGFWSPSGQVCAEVCSLQSAPELWRALGGLREVGSK